MRSRSRRTGRARLEETRASSPLRSSLAARACPLPPGEGLPCPFRRLAEAEHRTEAAAQRVGRGSAPVRRTRRSRTSDRARWDGPWRSSSAPAKCRDLAGIVVRPVPSRRDHRRSHPREAKPRRAIPLAAAEVHTETPREAEAGRRTETQEAALPAGTAEGALRTLGALHLRTRAARRARSRSRCRICRWGWSAHHTAGKRSSRNFPFVGGPLRRGSIAAFPRKEGAFRHRSRTSTGTLRRVISAVFSRFS